MRRPLFITILLMLLAVNFSRPIFASEKTYTESYQKQASEWQEFKVKQAKEKLAFQRKLKQMPSSERARAVFEFDQEQYKLEKAFRAKMHEERMIVLRRELESDPMMSQAKRLAILDFQEKKYQTKAAFFEALDQESIKLYQDVTSNPALTQKAKNEALKRLNNEQAEKRKKFAASEKRTHKEFQEKIRLL